MKLATNLRQKLSTSLLSILLTITMALGPLAIFAPVSAAPKVPVLENSYRGPKRSKQHVRVKFVENSGVRLRGTHLVSTNGTDLSSLDTTLSTYNVSKIQRLFSQDEASLDTDTAQLTTTSSRHLKNLNLYYRLTLKNDQAAALVTALKVLPVVETAYEEQLPTPSTAGPNLVSQQIYPTVAPTGLDSDYANTLTGGKGEKVRIADLEYSWNTNHEDLSKLRIAGAQIPNGTAVDPFNDTNHGTAVMGELAGDANTYGVTGMVPNAELHTLNVNNVETGWSIANAINIARQHLGAGDVILIEQQVWGVPGTSSYGYPEFVPAEYVQENYDAIAAATAAGITVVEAGANGAVNLDGPSYAYEFGGGRPDSGAIIVGAGGRDPYCSGRGQPARARLDFSNYGKRINLQGWGECVTTAGYGDVNTSLPQNSWYTYGFSGTSSASPMVTATVAALSSAYEAKYGTPATPKVIRDALVQTGTPQDTTGAYAGNIGPQPNLKAALTKLFGSMPPADTTAPSVPTNLATTIDDTGKVKLSWNASTDNVGVKNYKVYRNGTLLSSPTATSYTDTAASTDTGYSYTAQAVDAAGNASGQTAAVGVTTPLFTDDFELNNMSRWTSNNGLVTQTAQKYAGSYGARGTSTNGAVLRAEKTLSATKTDLYYRARVKVISQNANSAVNFMHVKNSNGGLIFTLYRTKNGMLGSYTAATNADVSSSTPMSLNTWYDIQMHTKINGTSSVTEVWLNGVKVTALSKTQNLGTAAIARITLGETDSGRTYDVGYDSVSVSRTYLK